MDEILQNHKRLTEELAVGPCEIADQNFLILSNWIYEVANMFKIRKQVIQHAIILYNNYLKVNQIMTMDEVTSKYVAASLYIAEIFAEGYMKEPGDYVYISDKGFTEEEFIGAVGEMVTVLTGKIMIPPPYVILKEFSQLDELSDQELRDGADILTYALGFLEFHQLSSFEMALSTIFYIRIANGAKINELSVWKWKYSDYLQEVSMLDCSISNPLPQVFLKLKPFVSNYHNRYLIHKGFFGKVTKKNIKKVESVVKSPGNSIDVDANLEQGGVLIGQGAYGTVMKFKRQGDQYVIKEQDYISSIKEIGIMRSLKHPNIQTVLGFGFATLGSGTIKMPLKKGDLVVILGLKSQTKVVPIAKLRRRNFAKQLFAGLSCLHANGIIHADIKPQNLLVDENDHLVITDFGISEVFVPHSADIYFTTRDPVKATIKYRDPNLLEAIIANSACNYSFEIDVWSAGIVLLEMEMGRFLIEYKKYEEEQRLRYERLLQNYGVTKGEEVPPAKRQQFYNEVNAPLITHELEKYTLRQIENNISNESVFNYFPQDKPFSLIMRKVLQQDKELRVTSAQAYSSF